MTRGKFGQGKIFLGRLEGKLLQIGQRLHGQVGLAAGGVIIGGGHDHFDAVGFFEERFVNRLGFCVLIVATIQLGKIKTIGRWSIGLGGYAIGAAEQVEVVDEGRTEIDLQRLEHTFWRDAEHVGLAAVDIGEHARG